MRPGRNKQPWGKVLVPHQGIHTAVPLRCSADTETPCRWEKLMINDGILPTSRKTPDQLDLKIEDADSFLPHHPPIRRLSTS